ncbi:hypothetical protein WOLCODRAFT_167816 [Wolfiporia cocos MD-104 SS10]|uniref:Uncharacterized protein n=1 Tax=Wolfiporia cocos (strain MD-104) TaxID=742152 RepID=A0A2H3JSV6_WOLCO|nr:hypothetical protein WOLCODRAFT_167816 [Wolfiporia cocos MD-104 SS10]
MLQDIIDDAVLGKKMGTGDSNTDKSNIANMDVDIDAHPSHNPFDNLPQDGSLATGAIVIGSPGIGKSVFLIYVLVLRLLAGLTTILQLNSKELYVFSDEGVFIVTIPIPTQSHLHLHIPDGTWCLIASNQRLAGVPVDVIELSSSCDGFILQAVSPRAERVDWTKKEAGRVPRYWMARWSLGELIVGRDLQFRYSKHPHLKPSETQLATFADLYGTSARKAYAYAVDPDDYKKQLYGKIKSLNRTKVTELVNKLIAEVMDDEIFHDILVAVPLRNRKDFDLQIATEHLWRTALDHLGHTEKHAADMLYRLFVRDSRTMASAGYLLERPFLVEFPKGGEWPMTVMSKSPRSGKTGTHWQSDGTKPQYLRLGYQGHIVAVANDRIEIPVEAFDRLDCQRFSCGEDLTLEDGFYIPYSRSQPSFDAFVYEAGPQRATIFQVTVSNRHPISAEGLDWLNRRGAKSLRLVVVTPSLDDDVVEDIDIWVANSHKDKLDEVYRLGLSGLKSTVNEIKKVM